MSKEKTISLIRSDLMQYIDEHEFLPHYMKPEMKRVVAYHFNCIGKILGLTELTFRRTYEHKDSIDPQLQKQAK